MCPVVVLLLTSVLLTDFSLFILDFKRHYDQMKSFIKSFRGF